LRVERKIVNDTYKSREHLECIFTVAKNCDVVPDELVVDAANACAGGGRET
jgi:hypothetical protein